MSYTVKVKKKKKEAKLYVRHFFFSSTGRMRPNNGCHLSGEIMHISYSFFSF